MIKFRNNGFILKVLSEAFEIKVNESEKKMIKRLYNEKDVSFDNYNNLLQKIKDKKILFDKNESVNQDLFLRTEKIANKIKDIYINILIKNNSNILKQIENESLAYFTDEKKVNIINICYSDIIRLCSKDAINLLVNNKLTARLDKYIDYLKEQIGEKSFNFLKYKENIYRSLKNFGKKKTGFYSILEIANEIRTYKNLSIEDGEDIFTYLTLISINYYIYKNLSISTTKNINTFTDKQIDEAKSEVIEFNKVINNQSIEISQVEELYKHESILQYQKDFFYAIYLEKTKRTQEALEKYIEVIKKAGQFDLKYLVKAIEFSYQIARTANYKIAEKIYNYGTYYKVITGSLEDNEWIKNHYKGKKNNYIGFDKIPSCEDLRHIESKTEYFKRKRTRLEIYSMAVPLICGKTEEELQEGLQKLIKNGADVNRVNDTGETPLILAICYKNWDRALLLLEQPVIAKTINQCSKKNKNTALLALILTFYDMPKPEYIPKVKEIFYKILEYNPDLNIKVGLDNGIYVRYLMSYLSYKNDKGLTEDNIRRNIDGFRRLGTPYDSITDDELVDFYLGHGMFHIPKYSEYKKQFLNFYKKMYREPSERAITYEFIKALLEKGSDINYKDNKNISTIMFAAEIGDLELFKLLESHGAYMYESEYSNNGLWFNLFINAMRWHSDAIVTYLRDNYPTISASSNIEKYIVSVFDALYNNTDYLNYKVDIIMKNFAFIEKYFPLSMTKEKVKDIILKHKKN